MLQNELSHKVPPEFLENFPQGAAIAYALIPQVPALPQPLKHEIQVAFAESLQVVWQVLIGVAGVGLLSALCMKGLPLHASLDEDWAPPSQVEVKGSLARKEGSSISFLPFERP